MMSVSCSVAPLESTFESAGIRCAATFHRPEANGAQPLAILMLQGWGGTQETLLGPFVAAFVGAGHAVMTFDYRGWGASDGLPRHVIAMKERERDAEAALAHLKNQPSVDPKRIVLWGSSLGGGHVVRMAARHEGLRGAIAQVPMLDGRAAILASPPLRSAQFVALGLADLLRGSRPIYIPTVGPAGSFASMDRDGAHHVLKRVEATTGKPYDNRVAARSLLTMGGYRPLRALHAVAIPMLVIGATRDTVAPFPASKVAAIANPRIQIEMIDANHFDPYFEPVFDRAIQSQLAFLRAIE
jgi:pimeloyl-ACP methyl ester carboxylesterase